VTQEVRLQQILGVDKRNPQFSLFRNVSAPGMVYVFYGADLLEIVPEDKSHAQFKLLIARLYKASVKAKALTDTFGVARTTMKRWGDALASGDAKQLVRALAGPGAPRKLTREVVAFVELRFRDIWAQTHYDYSARMRREIHSVFDVEICAETLRPLFNRLKEQLQNETGEGGAEPPGGAPPASEPKRASACDSESDPAGEPRGRPVTASARCPPPARLHGSDRGVYRGHEGSLRDPGDRLAGAPGQALQEVLDGRADEIRDLGDQPRVFE